MGGGARVQSQELGLPALFLGPHCRGLAPGAGGGGRAWLCHGAPTGVHVIQVGTGTGHIPPVSWQTFSQLCGPGAQGGRVPQPHGGRV